MLVRVVLVKQEKKEKMVNEIKWGQGYDIWWVNKRKWYFSIQFNHWVKVSPTQQCNAMSHVWNVSKCVSHKWYETILPTNVWRQYYTHTHTHILIQWDTRHAFEGERRKKDVNNGEWCWLVSSICKPFLHLINSKEREKRTGTINQTLGNRQWCLGLIIEHSHFSHFLSHFAFDDVTWDRLHELMLT